MKGALKAHCRKKFSDSLSDAVADTAVPAAKLAEERKKRIVWTGAETKS